MKVSCENLPASRVALTIEGDAEEYKKATEQAWRRIAGRVNIPGFRRGKAPRNIIARTIGEETIEEEALRLYLPGLYRRAVIEAGINPIGDPEFDVVQRDPLVVKATVSVRPEVKLGNYRELRLTREEPRVTEQQVDSQIEMLRQQHAEWHPVERPAAKGDIATLDVEGYTGSRPLLYSSGGQELLHADKGEQVLNETDWGYLVEPEMGIPVLGFADQVMGMLPGQEKEFRLPVPGDDPRFEKSPLAGKDISFKVRVKEVKEKVLPEVNEEFAKRVGSYDSVESLRQEMRSALEARSRAEEEARLAELAVSMAAAQTTVELPEEMVDREVDRRMQSLRARLENQHISFENYLKILEKSEPQIQGEIRNQAEKDLKELLVVDAIGEAEHIETTPEDIDNEIVRIGLAYRDGRRVQREYADPERRSALEARLRYEKTVKWLVNTATQAESTAGEASQATEAEATSATPSAEAEAEAAAPHPEE